MKYQTIKQKLLDGEKPTIEQIDKAIQAQLAQVMVYANSLAKHAARLTAGGFHPWPLPEDQEGRVGRRMASFAHEHARLTRLYLWRELVEHAPQVTEVGSA